MDSPPSGTVTFLFTDIVGSSALWEQYPDGMPGVLARHNEILGDCVRRHHGVIVKLTGDGVHAAFERASDAVRAAVAAQRALLEEPWDEVPEAPVHVRMGLHTGEALASGGDYYGDAVNRAARLMSLAHGDQILASQIVARLGGDGLGEGIALIDLGEHRLKDLARKERVFQVRAPGLRGEFPALASLDTFPNNLPLQLTSFVDREQEAAAVRPILEKNRLVTLIGPGGTGKTRLALQIGGEGIEAFPHGLWLVEFAPVSDPAAIPHRIASSLELREHPGTPVLETLTDYLRSRRSLLILDNCEHLVVACARVAESLLKQCADLHLLATSREALGVPGEAVFRVPALETPPVDLSPDLVEWKTMPAIRLFEERAKSFSPTFSVNEGNLRAVAQICTRLDGIPLAIELAAARVGSLGVDQIAARLDDRFRLLTGGSRTALPRQRTLQALIDWSYDLLSELERTSLQRLSVFVGGWSLEAAEAVVAGDGVEQAEVLNSLTGLVDKSLVQATQPEGEAPLRYDLMESIRQYAQDKLVEVGGSAAVRDRHRDYFVRFAEQAEARLEAGEFRDVLDLLEVEHDNLSAALRWGIGAEPVTALRIGGSIVLFWQRRGHITEGFEWLRQALEAAERVQGADDEEKRVLIAARAKALFGLGGLSIGLGRNEEGLEALRGSVRLYLQLEDEHLAARGRAMIATVTALQGDLEVGLEAAEAAIAALRQVDDRPWLAMALSGRARLAFMMRQDVAEVQHDLEESARLLSDLPTSWYMAGVLMGTSGLAAAMGDFDSARARMEQSKTMFDEMGDQLFANVTLSTLGHVERLSGHPDKALSIYRETILRWKDQGHRAAVAHELECIGYVAIEKAWGGSSPDGPSRLERAARLLGAAEALRELIGTGLAPDEVGEYEAVVDSLRAEMEEQAFERAWGEGRTLSMDQAIALALEPF